jgi:chorismate mutase
MKRLFPELMMISDPSHICGNRVDLQEIASKSLNLGYQGLMIETHINPDEAWTDKNQQINPDQLAALMANLSLKETKFEEKHLQELSQLREQINLYDDELLHLLKNRFDIALKIGQLKKENQVAVYQTNRWNEILERMITKGNHLDLSAEFIQNLMESIHMESIKLQDALKDEKLKL